MNNKKGIAVASWVADIIIYVLIALIMLIFLVIFKIGAKPSTTTVNIIDEEGPVAQAFLISALRMPAGNASGVPITFADLIMQADISGQWPPVGGFYTRNLLAFMPPLVRLEFRRGDKELFKTTYNGELGGKVWNDNPETLRLPSPNGDVQVVYRIGVIPRASTQSPSYGRRPVN
jgi:hypothetical protein